MGKCNSWSFLANQLVRFVPSKREPIHAVTLSLVVCTALASTAAAEYPDRPIRMIVPNSAGSATDVIGRGIGQRLTEAWGKQVVIDNRGGASGQIAHELTARAPADGYTLLFSTSAGMVINPLLNKVPYDPAHDFAPISLAVINPQMLVSHPSLGAKTVTDLLSLARAKPGELNCASPGVGTPNHLGCELLKTVGGVNFVHVPYKSTSPAISDLVGGQVDFMFNSMPAVYPLAKAGKLRALGVGSKKRSTAAPDVPTIAETLPGFECVNWYALFAPRGTPATLIAKLNAEMVKMFAEPAFAQRLAEQGSEPQTSTPGELSEHLRAESARWGRIMEQAGLRKLP